MDPSGRLVVIYALDSSCSANSSRVANAVTVKLLGNYGNHLTLCRDQLTSHEHPVVCQSNV